MIVENTSKERLVGSIKPMLVNVAVEPLRTDIAEDIADAILKDYVRRDELGLDEREMREILWNTWIPAEDKGDIIDNTIEALTQHASDIIKVKEDKT